MKIIAFLFELLYIMYMNGFLKMQLNKYYKDSDRIIENMALSKPICFRLNNCYENVREQVERELSEASIQYEIKNIKTELNKLLETGDIVLYSSDKNFDMKDFINSDVFDFEFYVVEDISLKDKIIEMDSYKNGYIYLQNPATFIPVLMLNPMENENIIDMCAAPGGKTMMIQSMTKNKSHTTAVELNDIRIQKMEYNFNKQNAKVYIMKNDSRKLDDNMKFDKVLLDAPCSGSGTLDLSNDKYEKYFTGVLIDKSVKRQSDLIKKAKNILSKGGVLVYSTCSILNDENEMMLDRARINNYISIKILPTKLFEGFFVAKYIRS